MNVTRAADGGWDGRGATTTSVPETGRLCVKSMPSRRVVIDPANGLGMADKNPLWGRRRGRL
jgi:hypothetical protein